MKRVLNIAVSGVSLVVLNQLKIQIISCLPSDIEVHWVNISEQHIDLLLVNKLFFHSSSIQNILSHHVSHYLCLIKVADNGGRIIDDTLSYPLVHLDELNRWLHDYCLNDSSVAKSKVMAEPTSHLEPLDAASIFDNIFNSNNGFIQVYDEKGFLVLIDTATDRIWANSEIPMLRFNNTIHQSYATSQFIQETISHQRTEDLYVGLWKILDRSITLNVPQVQLSQYFKLHIWPQLPAGSVRKDLFKLSACFAEGANIQMVADHLELSHQRIFHFIAIAQLLRMGQCIEPHEAKFIAPQQTIEEAKVNKISGFFGKLRKKLGL